MPRLEHIAIITWAMSWHTPRRSFQASAAVVRTDVAPWAYSNEELTRSAIASAVSMTSRTGPSDRAASRMSASGRVSGVPVGVS